MRRRGRPRKLLLPLRQPRRKLGQRRLLPTPAVYQSQKAQAEVLNEGSKPEATKGIGVEAMCQLRHLDSSHPSTKKAKRENAVGVEVDDKEATRTRQPHSQHIFIRTVRQRALLPIPRHRKRNLHP